MAQLIAPTCPLADAIATAPNGISSRHVLEDSRVDKSSLVRELLGRRPQSIVVVEGLASPTGGVAVPAVNDYAGLIAAASVADVRRFIAVTSRPHDDPELRRLRSSGVPYIVLRVPALLVTDAELNLAAYAARRVLVPEHLLEETAGALRESQVVDAVASALGGEVAVGRTVAVGELCTDDAPAIVAAVAAAGAEPVLAGTWRTRWASWLARPRVALTDDGRCVVVKRSPPGPARHADRALEAAC